MEEIIRRRNAAIRFLAACGLFALENNIERLAEDHNRAYHLAAAISKMNGLALTYHQLRQTWFTSIVTWALRN